MKYVCDFETTTDENDCRVWGWAIYDITNDRFSWGTNISEFFENIQTLIKPTLYFHNLKFDGEFAFYYLFEHGFIHTLEKNIDNMEFKTLISYTGVFYAIELKINDINIKIYDSYKIIPLAVEAISKAFNIKQLKGVIDYHKERHIGYIPTNKEIDYMKNDVEIVGKALNYFFKIKLNKITQASNAFQDFKKTINMKYYENMFPVLECHDVLKPSYKGGFTYVNPKFQNKIIESGIVLDVNSLYSSVMFNQRLPYGEPIYYDGNYVFDKLYDVYIQVFTCNFEIKKNHLPTLQIKKNCYFNDTDYVTDSDGLDVTLCMTNVDLELFLKHYDVYNIEYSNGWKFKSTTKIFKDYINKWLTIKINATKEGNTGLRTIAKLMLNALYGKFGLNPFIQSKNPTMNSDGMIKYVLGDEGTRNPIYIPVASFVTAYARKFTIESAQKNYDRFIYADTDSLHLIRTEEPNNLKIDKVNLGEWKVEYKFKRGRFIRAKSYIEELENGETHIACAGLPTRCHEKITFDTFINGMKVSGKLQHHRVKGGVVLKDIDFTIKM